MVLVWTSNFYLCLHLVDFSTTDVAVDRLNIEAVGWIWAHIPIIVGVVYKING